MAADLYFALFHAIRFLGRTSESSRGRRRLIRGLQVGVVVLGVGVLGLTAFLFAPLFRASAAPEKASEELALPAYDTAAWHSLAVLDHGRVKPFETACIEALRNITGRSTFGGKDAVSLVLTWKLLKGTAAGPGTIDWENYPFILCNHEGLRQMIYDDVVKRRKDHGDEPPTLDWVHGKYVCPADLYGSPTFMRLIAEVEKLHQQEGEKAQHAMSPEQRKAEEVEGRLGAYYAITLNPPQMAEQFRPPDPFHVVALDQVKGGGWFSVTELKKFRDTPSTPNSPGAWQQEMRRRVAETPQRYIPPEYRAELEKFQARMKDGTAEAGVQELENLREQEDAEAARQLAARHANEERIGILDLFNDKAFEDMTREELAQFVQMLGVKQMTDKVSVKEAADKFGEYLTVRDKERIDLLRQEIEATKGKVYHPTDEKFRMVHLNYLEARFPDLYRKSSDWQPYPEADAGRVLASYESLERAYLSGESPKFTEASQELFATLREASQKYDDYPGVATIPLELTFNRLEPFMWAWIIMLVSLGFFIASLATRSRACYALAFAFFFASLAFQVFGFYTRVRISGRAPVSNMYETVIWVAFMSAIFALVLELIYRRRVIGLAGALVSTIGLVLADQLPLVLDPKLAPLTPVLRSNFWLTIHVLTIVSSYAGGTLAWGLGNITLALMAIGTPRRDLLKTLSQFTYRAMQIAVLLLAVGTFLGAWWAADSWGRYWGWDPKEVWALIALVAYVIPLHMRYIGWVKDFGMAVASVLCYAAIVMSWYGVNFVLGAGLHSYGFGGGGPWWVFWAGLVNIEWVLIASILYLRKLSAVAPAAGPPAEPGEAEDETGPS
jgi:ABC-type transport system involved in cytochrome c biogenesis permease subunit